MPMTALFQRMFPAATFFTLLINAAAVSLVCAAGEPFIPDSKDFLVGTLSNNRLPICDAKTAKGSPPCQSPSPEQVLNSIQSARVTGDLRHLVAAERMTTQLINTRGETLELLLLRATVEDGLHRFEAAVEDIKKVLQVDPANIQALVLLASTQIVRGEYKDASSNCGKLLIHGNVTVSGICAAAVGGLTGKADKSVSLLNAQIGESYTEGGAEIVWGHLTAAEIETRTGKLDSAISRLHSLINKGQIGVYILSLLSDAYLATRNFDAIIALLEPYLESDALLIRYAIATVNKESEKKDEALSRVTESLAVRKARGEKTHLREDALVYLYVLKDPKKALESARQNWQIQKEPIDLRLLAAAAIAADDRDTMQQVMNWKEKIRLEDNLLEKILRDEK